MNTGTKSILFGYHQFVIHPIITAYSWYKMYGFPKDIRLWAAFAVHDIGYWGKPNMDGEEGEKHPEVGARLMHKWFDNPNSSTWYYFTVCHSRFYAKKYNLHYSKLCVVDKASIYLTPKWLYFLLVWLSGEYKEYLKGNGREAKGETIEEWYEQMCTYLKAWVEEHKDLKEDTWTKA